MLPNAIPSSISVNKTGGGGCSEYLKIVQLVLTSSTRCGKYDPLKKHPKELLLPMEIFCKDDILSFFFTSFIHILVILVRK